MPATAKICGVTTPEALDAAVAGGASHVGFVFFPKSPRNIALDQAASLARRADRRAQLVGLFVDPDPSFIDAVRAKVRLDVLQLHGQEHPAMAGRLRMQHGLEVWKAIAIRSGADLAAGRKFVGSANRLIYDAKPPADSDLPGGNGLRFDWRLLSGFDHPLPWALSGGLDVRNVKEAIATTGVRLVDVSSGVETAPGVKDTGLIAAFLKAVAQS